ncbi:hypothetical protein H310_06460 [Aphanomyces invadans]|uniref:Uncharacterized protein n=1 Tax=Aphanomyces invadans TaxID=157072 RepID=A0A024U692_9STRA|nr:hypothetical protein H310_06460 [Aphanomyces invadans]ETW01906.1 hypothetical protein H310_06460 [Aphanomyces invadans]|eukprot:XP_008869754.1 hypothetical protein H310_06460 [Aphanomyces invadans]
MFRTVSASAMRHLHAKRLTPAAGAALSVPGAAVNASIVPRLHGIASMSTTYPRACVTPAHVRGDVTTIAIAVAAVLGAAGVGKIWWDASSSQTGVNKDNLASYFNELADIVEELVSQMPQLMDAVMQQARATGQQITEAQVKAMLVERLGQAVQMADQDLARKYKFDQEAIETAMVELQHEPKVQAAIARLQSVIENSPLGETVEVPADLTADRTLEIMTLVLDGVSRAMEEALAEAKQAGMKNVNLEGHMWQENYMQKTYAYTAEIHEKFAVTEPILNAAINKHSQEDPAFQAKLQALLEKHQANFQRMGLQVE